MLFERLKFKRKYPNLAYFKNNKELVKKVIDNPKFHQYYIENYLWLKKYIDALVLLYGKRKTDINKIFSDNIDSLHAMKKHYILLSSLINYAKDYNNNITIISDNIETIEKIYQSQNSDEAKKFILNKIFMEQYGQYKKQHNKEITIKGRDISYLFENIQSIDLKINLLKLQKNDNLDFLAFIIEVLHKNKTKVDNLEEIFRIEVDDRIYSQEIREKLSEKELETLIVYYFQTTDSDRNIIGLIIEQKNYELLRDMLYFKDSCKFSRNINPSETNKDIFSIKKLNDYDIVSIIKNYLSPDLDINIQYLTKLQYIIHDDEIYNNFYLENKDIVDFLINLKQKFDKLSLEEKKKIYDYVKMQSEEDKKILVTKIKDTIKKVENLYKDKYSKTFKNSNDILQKAKEMKVSDSNNKEHSIKVYELKDNKPFCFLITAMHQQLRTDGGINMYNRPAHKITIDDPSAFCRDLYGGSEIISTSMINNSFIHTFAGYEPDLMYIFSDINADDIIGISPTDAGYSPKLNTNNDLFLTDRTPRSPDELIQDTERKSYNELIIRRKRQNNERVMPTAILCYDTINDVSIKHAQHFDIPIIVINTKTYDYLPDCSKKGEPRN